jgi:hypothetical protein
MPHFLHGHLTNPFVVELLTANLKNNSLTTLEIKKHIGIELDRLGFFSLGNKEKKERKKKGTQYNALAYSLLIIIIKLL